MDPLKGGYHLYNRPDDDPTLIAGLVALRFSRGAGPVLLRNAIAL